MKKVCLGLFAFCVLFTVTFFTTATFAAKPSPRNIQRSADPSPAGAKPVPGNVGGIKKPQTPAEKPASAPTFREKSASPTASGGAEKLSRETILAYLPEKWRTCKFRELGGVSMFDGSMVALHLYFDRLDIVDGQVGGPANIFLFRIDYPKAPIRFGIAEHSGTDVPFWKTSEAADKAGAIAAVNGGFFRWEEKVPFYFHKVDGKIYDPAKGGSGFAFNNNDKEVYFGRMTPEIKEKFDSIICGDYVRSGGAHLQKVDAAHSVSADRTVVGLAAENVIYIATVDGRQKGVSEGLTYYGGAELLAQFGCTEVFHLDGGGSTSFCLHKKFAKKLGSETSSTGDICRMNDASDRNERRVLDQLLILPAK